MEFAIAAPLLFLLLVGVVVTGVVASDQIALTNAVRNGARAAAVCGSDPTGTTQLPDGTSCTGSTGVDANVDAYVSSVLRQAQRGVATPTITVVAPDGTTYSSLANCQKGYRVIVSSSFAQPLYAPLVGHFLGDHGGSTRTIGIKAQATCEQ